MSLSPFWTPFKHHVTLPLWHQGQRVDQNQHTLPLFSSLQIWYILKWPSSPWVHAESSNIYFNEVHDSMNFLSPRLILTSNIQPSGFTYETQVPNQVGLQNLTSPYMTEYYNLHHGSQHDLFIKLQVWLFTTKTKKTSRERSSFRTIIMPTMHYSQPG